MISETPEVPCLVLIFSQTIRQLELSCLKEVHSSLTLSRLFGKWDYSSQSHILYSSSVCFPQIPRTNLSESACLSLERSARSFRVGSKRISVQKVSLWAESADNDSSPEFDLAPSEKDQMESGLFVLRLNVPLSTIK